MTRLKGGLALSLGAALVGTLLAGWRGALAAGAFGLLATAIQVVAARTMTPQTTRTRGEFVKSGIVLSQRSRAYPPRVNATTPPANRSPTVKYFWPWAIPLSGPEGPGSVAIGGQISRL